MHGPFFLSKSWIIIFKKINGCLSTLFFHYFFWHFMFLSRNSLFQLVLKCIMPNILFIFESVISAIIFHFSFTLFLNFILSVLVFLLTFQRSKFCCYLYYQFFPEFYWFCIFFFLFIFSVLNIHFSSFLLNADFCVLLI